MSNPAIPMIKVKDQGRRPSWDSYFMGLACEVVQRSTCNRARVGSVLVRDNHILTTGYNGSPTKLPHCIDVGCLVQNGHCIRTLHSEASAIIQAALPVTAGATLYVTHQPCFHCAKMIINAGIVRVMYGGDYPDAQAWQFLAAAGVALERAA